MDKLKIVVLIIVVAIFFEIFYIYETNTIYMQTNPSIQEISHNAKTYTMVWDAGNSTVTIVSPEGNTTLNVVSGQEFVCNGSSTLYQGKTIIFRTP